MLQLSIAGRCGQDAEYKQTQGGSEFCSFTVAADVGFGDAKQTVWVDVTRWGKGAKGLSDCLLKGQPVAVTGEMSLREHNGKTYIQCRADRVTLLGGRNDGQRQQTAGGGGDGWTGHAPSGGSNYDDLDSDIPFISRASIY